MTAAFTPPGAVPAPTTSFVGREHDTAAIGARLKGERLVTLTGAPGIGKTRLAAQVAELIVPRFPGGVWSADLASLARPERVPALLAAAVGVRVLEGQPPVDALVAGLRRGRGLLVLDTCEHLLAAVAPLVRTLLLGCPRLQVLATSREHLRLPGEVVWQVAPLTVPAPVSAGCGGHGSDPLAAVLASEAGRLFVDRARAAQPGLSLTVEEAVCVAEICRRLDGIPLAIETAAASAGEFPPSALVGQPALDSVYGFDRGGAVPARHRSLRAAIAWSFALLSEPEQVLLRRLALLADGWPLGAVEEICRGAANGRPAPLELLTSLVDKSLVVAEAHDGEMRYRLLEIVRAFAAVRLREAGDHHVAIRQRHAGWFLDGDAHAASASLPEAPPSASHGRADALTPREREIALHVARGLSSREIAGLLVTSRRTVDWHVKNVLAKLRLRSRTQLARWLIEQAPDGRTGSAARGDRR